MSMLWNSSWQTQFRTWGGRFLNRIIPEELLKVPLQTWQTTAHVMSTVLIASLLVNILSLAFPITLLQTYDRIIPNQSVHTLVILTIGVIVALIIEALLRIGRAYASGWADAKFEHMLGFKAFCKLTESSLSTFQRDGTGVHLERLSALSNLRDFYAGQILIALVDVPFVAVFLLLIAYIGGWIVLIPILTLAAFIYTASNSGTKLHELLTKRNNEDDTRFNFIIEVFTGIHTIKGIGMEAQMLRRYERLQNTGRYTDRKISISGSSNNSIGLFITQLTMVLVVAVGSSMVIHGQLTVGGLAACTLLSMRGAQPISRAINLWSRLQNIKLAEEKINKVISLPAESSPDLPDIPKLKGDIELSNVNFRFEDEKKSLFENLNLNITAGETVAIKSSGLSGKTSLLALILGIYQPSEGKVLLDGHDIKQYQANSVRKQIAYLPSEGKLFNGTIMENLTKFQEEEFHDQAKKIATQLGLADIIQSMPEGYDTMLGEQVSDTLSRGIKQRIVIARELIGNPSIVLFDEANTAIDIRGDEFLKSTLTAMKGKRTLVLISYRPSILQLADKTYTLEKGKISTE